MMKNKFISKCISDLSQLVEQDVLLNAANSVEGNFAIDIVRESVNTRISMLSDYLESEQSCNGVCAEFISSAIVVLEDDINDPAFNSFGDDFRAIIKFYIKQLSEILDRYT